MTAEPPEFYGALAACTALLGVVARLVFKKGCFCVSPCGPHVCIIDTKQNSESMKQFVEHMQMESCWKTANSVAQV